jgi:hypothetical protein
MTQRLVSEEWQGKQASVKYFLVFIETHKGGFSFGARGLEGLKVLHLAMNELQGRFDWCGFSRGYEEDFCQCHYTENFARLCPNE